MRARRDERLLRERVRHLPPRPSTIVIEPTAFRIAPCPCGACDLGVIEFHSIEGVVYLVPTPLDALGAVTETCGRFYLGAKCAEVMGRILQNAIRRPEKTNERSSPSA